MTGLIFEDCWIEWFLQNKEHPWLSKIFLTIPFSCLFLVHILLTESYTLGKGLSDNSASNLFLHNSISDWNSSFLQELWWLILPTTKQVQCNSNCMKTKRFLIGNNEHHKLAKKQKDNRFQMSQTHWLLGSLQSYSSCVLWLLSLALIACFISCEKWMQREKYQSKACLP